MTTQWLCVEGDSSDYTVVCVVGDSRGCISRDVGQDEHAVRCEGQSQPDPGRMPRTQHRYVALHIFGVIMYLYIILVHIPATFMRANLGQRPVTFQIYYKS